MTAEVFLQIYSHMWKKVFNFKKKTSGQLNIKNARFPAKYSALSFQAFENVFMQLKLTV